MSSLLAWPIGLAYHFVLTLAHVLTPAAGPLATAAAIIAFTVAVRLVLLPLSFSALRGQARIAAIQPRVQELRTRYARQPDRLQSELGSLYAQEAGGMLAGCLPLLIQLPFFSIMYRLFLSGTVGGHANTLLRRDLFGTPLGSHLFSGALAAPHVLVFAGLLVLLAAVATLSVRAARSAAATAPSQPAGPAGLILKLLPYTTVVFAAIVPLAAGLYLLTSTTWSAAERVLLRRRIGPAPRELRPAGDSVP